MKQGAIRGKGNEQGNIARKNEAAMMERRGGRRRLRPVTRRYARVTGGVQWEGLLEVVA